MNLPLIYFLAGFMSLSSSCAVMKFEHCAPQNYRSHEVNCFPIDTAELISIKIVLKSIAEKNDLIFETKNYQVVLAENQTLHGRAIVRLKRACGDLACLTPE